MNAAVNMAVISLKHWKRVINNKRYVLDFRNPDVRAYCRDVVDRLIRDYGCEYFKVDYNVTTGIGSDLCSDSYGDAMLEHYRALYDWNREIFKSYPDLIIETYGSGGQRMDYGMLELFSLQSVSDQTDYLYHSFITANVASALTPEQAGAWVYPYEDDREHVIYNVVNGLLLRPYCSGKPWILSPDNRALYREGMDTYKVIRSRTCRMTLFSRWALPLSNLRFWHTDSRMRKGLISRCLLPIRIMRRSPFPA